MKALKKLGCILAAGVMAFGASALVACGGETADELTVYFKDAQGNAMSNVTVGICTYANGSKGNCLAPQAADANGKIVFNLGDFNTAFENDEFDFVINEDSLTDEGYLVVQGGYANNLLTEYGEYTVTLVEME